jgi:hypothetical protein
LRNNAKPAAFGLICTPPRAEAAAAGPPAGNANLSGMGLRAARVLADQAKFKKSLLGRNLSEAVHTIWDSWALE